MHVSGDNPYQETKHLPKEMMYGEAIEQWMWDTHYSSCSRLYHYFHGHIILASLVAHQIIKAEVTKETET